MQIVIDISEEDYEYLKKHNKHGLYSSILNGTPLPKGHGRLKDVDHYIKMQWEHPDHSLTDDEPTIIEADTAESEEV